jgi:ribosomal protein S18 acetylase RimI-like enzyme
VESALASPAVARERISLRPEVPADEPFLLAVYASSRAPEMRLVAWPEEQKRAFLSSQFHAQRASYRDRIPDAAFDVILLDGERAGRFYVHRGAETFELVDIALLEKHRDAGIGGTLVRELLAEAARAGKPVRLYVELENPARRLYERLGFRPIGDTGVYQHMEWRPNVS